MGRHGGRPFLISCPWNLANVQAVFGNPTGEDACPTLWRGRPRPRLVFGHFRRGTNVKSEVDAWIAAQRLDRLAQAAVATLWRPSCCGR